MRGCFIRYRNRCLETRFVGLVSVYIVTALLQCSFSPSGIMYVQGVQRGLVLVVNFFTVSIFLLALLLLYLT